MRSSGGRTARGGGGGGDGEASAGSENGGQVGSELVLPFFAFDIFFAL